MSDVYEAIDEEGLTWSRMRGGITIYCVNAPAMGTHLPLTFPHHDLIKVREEGVMVTYEMPVATVKERLDH